MLEDRWQNLNSETQGVDRISAIVITQNAEVSLIYMVWLQAMDRGEGRPPQTGANPEKNTLP